MLHDCSYLIELKYSERCLLFVSTFQFAAFSGPGSSVGIATDYKLDSPGSKSTAKCRSPEAM